MNYLGTQRKLQKLSFPCEAFSAGRQEEGGRTLVALGSFIVLGTSGTWATKNRVVIVIGRSMLSMSEVIRVGGRGPRLFQCDSCDYFGDVHRTSHFLMSITS